MFAKINNWLSKIKNRNANSFSIISSEPSFWNKYGSLIILGLGGLFVILLLPALIQLPSKLEVFDYTKGKDVGSTIGGISGPFLSLIGIIFVYITFQEQRKTNEISKSSANELRLMNELDSIERYFMENKGKFILIVSKLKSKTIFNPNQHYKSNDYDKNDLLLVEFFLLKIFILTKHGLLENEFLLRKAKILYKFAFDSSLSEINLFLNNTSSIDNGVIDRNESVTNSIEAIIEFMKILNKQLTPHYHSTNS